METIATCARTSALIKETRLGKFRHLVDFSTIDVRINLTIFKLRSTTGQMPELVIYLIVINTKRLSMELKPE
jgi:hypothetical protein